jgi:hypothetical protein
MVGLFRRGKELEARLFGQTVSLPIVTGRAAGYNVLPGVASAPGEGEDMVPRKELAASKFASVPPAVLARVVVPGEEEGVGHLSTKTPGDLDESDQANHKGERHFLPL